MVKDFLGTNVKCFLSEMLILLTQGTKYIQIINHLSKSRSSKVSGFRNRQNWFKLQAQQLAGCIVLGKSPEQLICKTKIAKLIFHMSTVKIKCKARANSQVLYLANSKCLMTEL